MEEIVLFNHASPREPLDWRNGLFVLPVIFILSLNCASSQRCHSVISLTTVEEYLAENPSPSPRLESSDTTGLVYYDGAPEPIGGYKAIYKRIKYPKGAKEARKGLGCDSDYV